jgi:uncharacterized membrane protein
MVLDAVLAYLHFAAIFVLFGYMVADLREDRDVPFDRAHLGRADAHLHPLRRMLDRDPAWTVPADEQRKMRRLVMVQLHLVALIPVFAVIMARGLGR